MENVGLQSLQISHMVLRAEIVTTFGSKMITISARNTILRKFANFTTFKRFFPKYRFYCPDQKLVYNANCQFRTGFAF